MTIFHPRLLKFNQKNEEKEAVKIGNEENKRLHNKESDLKLDVEDEKKPTKPCTPCMFECDWSEFLCNCTEWIAIGFMIFFIVCLMIYFLIILGYGAFSLITNIIEYVSK